MYLTYEASGTAPSHALEWSNVNHHFPSEPTNDLSYVSLTGENIARQLEASGKHSLRRQSDACNFKADVETKLPPMRVLIEP